MRQFSILKSLGLLTRYLWVVLEPLPYTIFWGHRGFRKARVNFYAPDGIHLNGLGLRGAVLRSLRLLQCPPNWGVDCVLAYNSFILCHFICCDIFYRAFDLMLLHYSFVLHSFMHCLILLSFMSCLISLSFVTCLIVVSFMSCSISLSFRCCLITLALVVFWVRHIPQECTTYSGRSLRWLCPIALGIVCPWHFHWHITTVIPFYFNFCSNLISLCTCRGVFLSRTAVP